RPLTPVVVGVDDRVVCATCTCDQFLRRPCSAQRALHERAIPSEVQRIQKIHQQERPAIVGASSRHHAPASVTLPAYSCRIYATSASFSVRSSLSCRTRLKNSTVSSKVISR